MQKVRILFLRHADAHNTNSQSLTVREIVLRLDPNQFECTLWYETEPDPRLHNRSNIRLIRLPAHGKTWRILREMCAGYDLIAYMDYSPASYVFVHLPRVLRGKARTILQVEGPSGQSVNSTRLFRILSRGIAAHCDAYTALSEFLIRDFTSASHRAVNYIVSLGVDTRFFSPPMKRTGPVPTILFVGTVIERKGPQYVLDAAVRFPEAKFRILGAGRNGHEKVLLQKISEQKLTNVTLEGPKSQAEIMEAMRQSDIFLFPSRLEGIPKVTLEAAAMGLPCIVFCDYATPSVVDGVTGFQVSTLEEMLDRLGALIADPALRETMGKAARRHAEQFDWEIVSRQWQDVYLKIAAAHKQCSR